MIGTGMIGLVRPRGIELAGERDRGLSGIADAAAQGRSECILRWAQALAGPEARDRVCGHILGEREFVRYWTRSSLGSVGWTVPAMTSW